MHFLTSLKKFGLTPALWLLSLTTPIFAAPPVITSAAQLDIYYDIQTPGDAQFSYRIVATGAAATFDASGLPALTTLDRTTGWIVGPRNVPGVYDIAIRATNAEGTNAA